VVTRPFAAVVTENSLPNAVFPVKQFYTALVDRADRWDATPGQSRHIVAPRVDPARHTRGVFVFCDRVAARPERGAAMRCGKCNQDVDLSEMRTTGGGWYKACLICRTSARIRDLERTLERARIARQIRDGRRAYNQRIQSDIEARRFRAAGDFVS